VLSAAMEQQWLAAAKEIDEFGGYLCPVLVRQWYTSSALLTLRVLDAFSAGYVVDTLHTRSYLMPDPSC
jgi:hypothetical protein